MDINILDKLGEEYDFVRQKFYSIMKNKMALNEKEEIPFNESTFDKLKKSKEDIYKETLVTSWDFGLNQQFKNADKTVVVYDKMQTNDKKEMDKIPMLNYQKGDPCVYHLCYCDELRKLTQKETRSIWVFARPIDGYLTIVEEDENKHRVTMSTNKIEVCPTCFNALRLKEIGYRQEEFDIKRFLYEYPSNCSIKMPKIDISVDSADQASVEMSIRRKKYCYERIDTRVIVARLNLKRTLIWRYIIKIKINRITGWIILRFYVKLVIKMSV